MQFVCNIHWSGITFGVFFFLFEKPFEKRALTFSIIAFLHFIKTVCWRKSIM